ncbi:hypothetical protein BDZ45DRAFT_757231 [Acephala macrosclerotiorum]|nr:hypothetical protein BDZ45DRAFT_757231 [Acephala macrosclerotiorum]
MNTTFTEQPGPRFDGFGTIGSNETQLPGGFDANFELKFDFHSHVVTALLDNALERQNAHGETIINDPVLNDLLNDFGQGTIKKTFGIDINDQEFDFSDSVEPNPSASSAEREMNVSSNRFDLENINNMFSPDITGQEINFSDNLHSNADTQSRNELLHQFVPSLTSPQQSRNEFLAQVLQLLSIPRTPESSFSSNNSNPPHIMNIPSHPQAPLPQQAAIQPPRPPLPGLQQNVQTSRGSKTP